MERKIRINESELNSFIIECVYNVLQTTNESKMPVLPVKEVLKRMQKNGFIPKKGKGDHIKMVDSETGISITIPVNDKSLNPALFRGILRRYWDTVPNLRKAFSEFKPSTSQIAEALTRSDVNDEIGDYMKTKDFEKRVHNIVVDAFNDLIQNMWTKKSFWTTMLKKK